MNKGIVAIIVALFIAFSFNIVYANNLASIEYFDPSLVGDISPDTPIIYEYRHVLSVEWSGIMVVIVTPDDQSIGVLGDARDPVANFATEAYITKKPIKIGRVGSLIVSIGLAEWDSFLTI